MICMLKCNILAHRGCWNTSEDKNSIDALTMALDIGYGIETDLRDLNGSLVVCHDPATTRNSFPADELFSYYSNKGCKSSLALNIKSDGLQELLKRSLDLHSISADNFYVFDMSIPDLSQYLKARIPSYTRLSDLETEPVLINQCKGIWLDDFNGCNSNTELIEKYLLLNYPVAVVSPELHGRCSETLWSEIKDKDLHRDKNFYLCTDRPDAAFEFFKVEK